MFLLDMTKVAGSGNTKLQVIAHGIKATVWQHQNQVL